MSESPKKKLNTSSRDRYLERETCLSSWIDAKGNMKLRSRADYASMAETSYWWDYHPEGALIIGKVTCKARFEKWLED
jgi:hypothetical protein